jgi:hypothetical protein
MALRLTSPSSQLSRNLPYGITLAFVGDFAHKCVPFHTAGKGELGISLSLTLTALALLGKFAHTCRPFLNHALTKFHD